MFCGIDIKLRNPICECDEQDLNWGIDLDVSGKPGLMLQCAKCGVKVTIPHSSFKARFVLDKPYPGKAKSNTDNGAKGNILEFRPPKK